jgi:nucleotide-binding universal stress UspA family protein
MLPMPIIRVPLDFSDTALDALRYAIVLGEASDLAVEAIHVYDGYGEEEAAVEVRGNVRAQLAVQRRMADYLCANSPLPVPAHAIIGDPPGALTTISHLPDTALLVLGGAGTGKGSEDAFYYGSVARALALRGGCPVLLVPGDYGVPLVERTAYTFERVEGLRQLIDRTDWLREALGTEVRLAHIMDRDPDREARKEIDLMDEVLETGFPGFPVELDLLPPEDITDGLTKYVREYDVDLLVVGRRRRSWVERLFIGSEVAPLLQRLPVPLLVIPIDSY